MYHQIAVYEWRRQKAASACNSYRKHENTPRHRRPSAVERARILTSCGGGSDGCQNCEAFDANISGPDRPSAIGDLARNGSDAAAIRGVAGGRSIARAKDEDLRADHEANAAARGLVVLDCGRQRRAGGHRGPSAFGRGGKIGAETAGLRLRGD